MSNAENSEKPASSRPTWKQVLVGVLILGASAGIMLIIFSTEPEAVRETATKKTAMLVTVESVEAGTYRPMIEVMGTVIPFREVMLRPRVEGEVLEVSDTFVPGRVVEKGEMLLRIDSRDYDIARQLRESDVKRAQAEVTLEKGRRVIAQQDFERMGGDLSPENKALVLREPQFQTAQAELLAAQASLDRAELDVERTTLSAPFRAKVLERFGNVGSQVSPQNNVAHLVDVNQFWVEATVPYRVLPWLDFPETAGDQGVEVTLRNTSAMASVQTRTGHLDQLIGSLDQQTRMVRILVKVEDPLLLDSEDPSGRLLLGTFVRLDVPVRELQDVVRVNRDWVHSGDTVWVMTEEGILEIREVDVEFRDKTHAYVRSGLTEGDTIVISQLATVREGAALRVRSENDS